MSPPPSGVGIWLWILIWIVDTLILEIKPIYFSGPSPLVVILPRILLLYGSVRDFAWYWFAADRLIWLLRFTLPLISPRLWHRPDALSVSLHQTEVQDALPLLVSYSNSVHAWSPPTVPRQFTIHTHGMKSRTWSSSTSPSMSASPTLKANKFSQHQTPP